jgi:hypothetical protein
MSKCTCSAELPKLLPELLDAITLRWAYRHVLAPCRASTPHHVRLLDPHTYVHICHALAPGMAACPTAGRTRSPLPTGSCCPARCVKGKLAQAAQVHGQPAVHANDCTHTGSVFACVHTQHLHVKEGVCDKVEVLCICGSFALANLTSQNSIDDSCHRMFAMSSS